MLANRNLRLKPPRSIRATSIYQFRVTDMKKIVQIIYTYPTLKKW